ncbi:pyridoxal-dependent decarboxylase [Lentzea sp. DG1S-22]|uniref:pyridoxal-dependent decarboxylase n=1 Tax=Lentzea sp. DG1S-22 TaxID=3108822 RepID=UPI003FA576A2
MLGQVLRLLGRRGEADPGAGRRFRHRPAHRGRDVRRQHHRRGDVLGTTFDGFYEPVRQVCAALDRRCARDGVDVPVHVDAASGGMVAPFPDPALAWDFRLPRVSSINMVLLPQVSCPTTATEDHLLQVQRHRLVGDQVHGTVRALDEVGDEFATAPVATPELGKLVGEDLALVAQPRPRGEGLSQLGACPPGAGPVHDCHRPMWMGDAVLRGPSGEADHADGAAFGRCPENGPIVTCQVWSDHHFWPASPSVEIGS